MSEYGGKNGGDGENMFESIEMWKGIRGRKRPWF